MSLSEDVAKLEISDNVAAAKRTRIGLMDTEKQMKDFRKKVNEIKFEIIDSRKSDSSQLS